MTKPEPQKTGIGTNNRPFRSLLFERSDMPEHGLWVGRYPMRKSPAIALMEGSRTHVVGYCADEEKAEILQRALATMLSVAPAAAIGDAMQAAVELENGDEEAAIRYVERIPKQRRQELSGLFLDLCYLLEDR
jgi:hypothetical protein